MWERFVDAMQKVAEARAEKELLRMGYNLKELRKHYV